MTYDHFGFVCYEIKLSRKAISIKFPTVSFRAYKVLVFVLFSERHSPGSGVRLKRCAFQEAEQRKKERKKERLFYRRPLY